MSSNFTSIIILTPIAKRRVPPPHSYYPTALLYSFFSLTRKGDNREYRGGWVLSFPPLHQCEGGGVWASGSDQNKKLDHPIVCKTSLALPSPYPLMEHNPTLLSQESWLRGTSSSKLHFKYLPE
jgi:hypothetical protein